MVSVCLPSDALSQYLPSYLGFSYLGHGVSVHGCSGKVQLLLLTLDKGYLLRAPLLTLNVDFILGGAKITADGDCSHEIKKHLLLGRKVMSSLDSILKSRDITLPTKVHLVKAMVFPVVMYGCESWTVKKPER